MTIYPVHFGNSTIIEVEHYHNTWVEYIQYVANELGMLIVLVGVNFSHNDLQCVTPSAERQLWNPSADSGFPKESVSASNYGYIVWDAFCFPFSPPTEDLIF